MNGSQDELMPFFSFPMEFREAIKILLDLPGCVGFFDAWEWTAFRGMQGLGYVLFEDSIDIESTLYAEALDKYNEIVCEVFKPLDEGEPVSCDYQEPVVVLKHFKDIKTIEDELYEEPYRILTVEEIVYELNLEEE